MTNILTETLDQIYDNLELQSGGTELKQMLTDILRDCECENPTVDIQIQLETLIEDIEMIKGELIKSVLNKQPSESPRL